MPRILFTSDLHIDNKTRGYERADDVLHALQLMVRAANISMVDLFIFGGDLFDAHDPDERCWGLLADVRLALSSLNFTNVLLVAGNHDTVDRKGCPSALLPLAGIIHNPLAGLSRHCPIVAERGVSLVLFDLVSVLCLPHISPVHVDGDDVQEYVERESRRLIENAPTDKPLIAISHLELDEVEFGSEQDMPRGQRAPRLPDFLKTDPRVKWIGQGHYHTAQTIGKIEIVGSPERHSFNEASDAKGYLLIDL